MKPSTAILAAAGIGAYLIYRNYPERSLSPVQDAVKKSSVQAKEAMTSLAPSIPPDSIAGSLPPALRSLISAFGLGWTLYGLWRGRGAISFLGLVGSTLFSEFFGRKLFGQVSNKVG
ncbi:hypothetical protein W02_16780 [Nitrospira sp. KM1]|uniref:hypothetical protein n=1 Tax=Nitrospira sp. KM1 TaxID=1936990 RepID=UPI0013A73A10|nr:hypothetical protein [Nitrospira sp. KM1]BCA54538.1 hypothetical protein W02_16780 [Nitrospira sp. KM1]